MTNWYDDPPTFTELNETGVAGRPAFVANFYAHEGLQSTAQSIFDAWLALLPSKTPLFYSHDKSKRFAKVTPKALAKLREEFAEASISKQYKDYIIKSAPEDGMVDAPHAYSLEMYAAANYSGYAYVTFPQDHVERQGADAVVTWFRDWCERFGFTHADAGLGYEVAWFHEQAQGVGPVMLAKGLRFHGFRVWHRGTARFRDRNKRTLDTAGWLTFLDASALEEIGPAAIDNIPAGVMRYPVGSGLLLRTGPSPDPCDTNRRGPGYALLKAVNDAVAPIRTVKWAKMGWADRKNVDKEESWFKRMDD